MRICSKCNAEYESGIFCLKCGADLKEKKTKTVSPEIFDYSSTELVTINQALEPKLAWAKTRVAETEQMALDATRLLSCTESRLNDYVNQGFFKRCWHKLCGKQGEMQRANQKDLTEMQKYAWRYINLLNERDLLLAHSLITVKNNLMTLAIAQEETRNEIARMAEKVYERFVALENRVKDMEVATKIHGWLLTIDTYDYDEKYPPHFRLLKVIRDFLLLKEDYWNIMEIKYLQKAVKEVGLPLKKEIKLSDFIDELIDEIEDSSFSLYQELLLSSCGESDKNIPGAFILENIPVPSFTSLYQISDNYAGSSATIEVLAEQLNLSKKEAIKKVMTTFIKKQGIDLEISVPLRDLAVELLGCMKLTKNLFDFNEIDQNRQVHEDKKSATVPVDEDISDEEKDLDWYLKAAEQGDAEAQCSLGYIYYGEKDYKKAFEWFSKAAEQGHAEAQYGLGRMCYLGDYVEKNYQKAFEWYLKSAEQGYADAQYELGNMYRLGEYVERDYEKAFGCYLRSAEQGNDSAQYRVGYCYYIGLGAGEDYQKAFKWFSESASKDNDCSLYYLGRMYSAGNYVSSDRQKSLEYFRKASDKGNSEAQIEMAVLYFFGDGGVSQSFYKAEEYIIKSISERHYLKDDLIEDFLMSCAIKLHDWSKFYYFDNMPENKKNNASKTFLKPFITENEAVYLFYDDTFFGAEKKVLPSDKGE